MNNHIIPSNIINFTVKVLNSVADIFKNTCYIEYCIKDTPENRIFVENMEKWNNPDKEINLNIYNGKIITINWLVMNYCAYLLNNPNP